MPSILSAETENSLRAAIQEFSESLGALIRPLAVKYRVNYNTLKHRLRDRKRGNRQVGGLNSILNESQEKAIIQWIKDQYYTGWPVTTLIIQEAISQLRESKELPTMKWVRNWLQKHSKEVIKSKMKPMDSRRKSAQNPEIIEDWFTQYKIDLRLEGFKPENIWNMDETGFRVGCPHSQNVIIPKGEKQVSIEFLLELYK